MKHKVYYNNDREVLVTEIIGDFTTEEASRLGAIYDEQLEGKPYRQLIVELSNAGKMESRDTRKVVNEQLDQAKITHVAYVGAVTAIRMIAKVLMKLGSLEAEATFVKDMDAAYNWVESKK